jgi:hypothetical protein
VETPHGACPRSRAHRVGQGARIESRLDLQFSARGGVAAKLTITSKLTSWSATSTADGLGGKRAVAGPAPRFPAIRSRTYSRRVTPPRVERRASTQCSRESPLLSRLTLVYTAMQPLGQAGSGPATGTKM